MSDRAAAGAVGVPAAGQGRTRTLTLPGLAPLQLLMLTTATVSTVWWQLPLVPGRLVGEGPGPAPLAVADIMAVVTALVSLLVWFRRRQRPSLRPLGLAVPTLLVVGLALGGAPHAPDRLLALGVASHLALLALLYAIYASGELAPALVAVAVTTGLLVQLPLAIEQVVRQTTSPLGFLMAWPGDYSANTPDASVLLATGSVRWLRAYGPFPHPNILGGYFAMELLLLIGLIVATRTRLAAWFPLVLLGLPVGLVLTGLALAASRSAWLGAVAGLAALGVGYGRRRVEGHAPWLPERRSMVLFAALAVLTLCVALVLLHPPLGGRLAADSNRLEEQSVQERLFFDQVGLRLLAAHPLFGVGAGNAELAEVRFFHQSFGPGPIHNMPLLMAVELGPVGAFAWVLAAGYIVVQTWRYPGRWTVPFGASLVALGVAGLFDHYGWTFSVAGDTVAIIAGGWAAALNGERRSRSL